MTDRPLDTVPLAEVVDRTLAAQAAAVDAVRAVAADVAAAADLVTGRFAAGGRLFLAATPGVATRVLDLATTGFVAQFGFADGAVARWDGDTAGVDRPSPRDAVVLVALDDPAAAAGLSAAAVRTRAGLVLITGDRDEDDDAADVVVRPATGPDVVAGLPRLAVATAAKAVLDAVTTAVAVLLGHVHGDLPVDLVVTDDRAGDHVVRMVAAVADVDLDTARQAAAAADHDVRTAVVGLVAGLDPAGAARHAAAHRTLRGALARPPTPLPGRGPASPPAGGGERPG